jgi:hypothetical protein
VAQRSKLEAREGGASVEPAGAVVGAGAPRITRRAVRIGVRVGRVTPSPLPARELIERTAETGRAAPTLATSSSSSSTAAQSRPSKRARSPPPRVQVRRPSPSYCSTLRVRLPGCCLSSTPPASSSSETPDVRLTPSLPALPSRPHSRLPSFCSVARARPRLYAAASSPSSTLPAVLKTNHPVSGDGGPSPSTSEPRSAPVIVTTGRLPSFGPACRRRLRLGADCRCRPVVVVVGLPASRPCQARLGRARRLLRRPVVLRPGGELLVRDLGRRKHDALEL